MTLTQKHFERIAEILKSHKASDELITDFEVFCSEENTLFDRQRFWDACIEDDN